MLPKIDITKTSKDILEFLKSNTHRLKKPSTYLGWEINSCKIDWDSAKTHIILYMPISYQAAINNLGVAILYNKLNDIPDVICERGYMPESKLRNALIKNKYPIGFSLETKNPLTKFDCIGFSCYFELQFLNVIHTLHYSGIPVYSKDRGNSDEYPIVIMGGVAAYSPAAVEKIVDMVFIGDGEEQMGMLVKQLAAYRIHKDKEKFLLDCVTNIPGCYAPKFYTFEYNGRWIKSIASNIQHMNLPSPVIKACYDINKSTPFYKQILPEVSGILIGYGNVEIARGCYNSCRFCMASAIYKPYREYSLDKIDNAIDEAIGFLGCNDITPHSLNYSAYSQKYKLLEVMASKLKKISASSQRMDTFSPILARVLHERGTNRATFAIEAGSQRMRDVINKEITRAHIDLAFKTLIDLKYKSVKIYMISGLPFETDADRQEIIKVLKPWVEYAAKKAHPIQIRLSYTQFTAKPFTALQWADVSDVLDTTSTTNWGNLQNIRTLAKEIDVHVKSSLGKAEHIMLQLLNRVDGRFSDALVQAAINDRLIYNSKLYTGQIPRLSTVTGSNNRLQAFIDYLDNLCLQYTGIGIQNYFTEIPTEKILPDILSAGVDRKWLVTEYESARKAATTPSCAISCSNCGVCTNGKIIKQYATPHPNYIKQNTDISDSQLVKNINNNAETFTGDTLLVTLNIPEASRFTESSVLKRQLILAYNSAGIFVDTVSLQSDKVLYRGYRFGEEFAIIKLRNGVEFEEDNDILDEINAKLEGLVKVTDIFISENKNADKFNNIAKYTLYKLEIVPTNRQRKNEKEFFSSLDVINASVTFIQNDGETKQNKAKNLKSSTIPLIKAKKRKEGIFVYALVPLDVNVYYLVSHLLYNNSNQVVRLMRKPLERLAFISGIEYSNAGKCVKCNGNIEITDERISVARKLLDSNEKICVSCLITNNMI